MNKSLQETLQEVTTALEDINSPDTKALRARIKALEHELEVQKGVVEFVYIPVRHMTERADKYEARNKLLVALAKWCKPDEHSPPEHWAAFRACFPSGEINEYG